jgi:hypothetical protein
MIWLLLIPFIGLVILGIVLMRNDDFSIGGVFASVGGWLGVLVLVIALPSATVCNGSHVAEMQAFYNTNTKNLAYAVDETASYLSADIFKDGLLIEGSIEKLQQAGYVSERIKDWVEKVNQYNKELASLKYYNANPFTGVLIPDEVEDMRFLVIE